jgi:cobalt-zinc-cadmium efflux system outer membrane protein
MPQRYIDLIRTRGIATRAGCHAYARVSMPLSGKEHVYASVDMAPMLNRIGRAWEMICLCLLAVWLVGGCESYESKPLPEASDVRLEPAPGMRMMELLVTEIKHPILRPVRLDPNEGVTPEAAGVLAVMLNPSLRAVRDQRALANAQLLQAGLLPNPELVYEFEAPISDSDRKVNGFGLGVNWGASSLVSRSTNVRGGETHRLAVEADVAWQEWQTAQAAKTAVFALVGLQGRIAQQEQARRHLDRNTELVRQAVAGGTLTAKDLSAAESASRQAYAALLDLEKQAEQQRLQLNRLLGLPPESMLRLSNDIELPSAFEPPAAARLLIDIEQRRLDLIALRHGYNNQEAAVRAAVLNQFPRIGIGPMFGRDVDNIDTAGFGVTMIMPIFDHNQGTIAFEQATRQRLYDEYVNRLFETQSDVAMLLSRIRFLNEEIAATAEAEAELTELEASYRTALAAGQVDILTYYTAWNDAVASRMKLLTLREQLAEAIVALELTTGFYQIPKPVVREEAQP